MGGFSLFESYLARDETATTSLQAASKKSVEGTHGPVGLNTIRFNREGCVLSSSILAFRPGNTVYDYIHTKFHRQMDIIIKHLPEIRNQPVVFDFEVLFGGRYYHRRANVFYDFENFLAIVDDVTVDSNVVDFSTLSSDSYNEFTVARNGLVLSVKFPEKTIPGDPAGSNFFDVLLPEYKSTVRSSINRVLRKRIELPIQYEFEVNGQRRFKVGTIKPRGGNVIFCVRRIARPHKF